MHPFEYREFPRERLVDVALGGLDRTASVRLSGRREFERVATAKLLRVATKELQCIVIEIDKSAALRIKNNDRLGSVFDERPIPTFALKQLFL